jgi:hypothetical protein
MYLYDPILKTWELNYRNNERNGNFNRSNIKSIKFLENRLNNIPIVLVGASPHLDDNINILKEYQKKIIIICCDVALKNLLDKDIYPAFCCTIDPQKILEKHLLNIPIEHNINLICPTTIYPTILSDWKFNVYLFNQTDKISFKNKFINRLTQSTNYFPKFLNMDFVGMTMYQSARYMSSGKIILVGYGFGYKDGKIYCDGVYEARGIKTKHTKLNTSPQLERYGKYFIETITNNNDVKNIINATEGGCLNCNNMPLKSVLHILEDLAVLNDRKYL